MHKDFRQRKSDPSRGSDSTIFTEPEENNCFSIIAQVIIRATAFLFILLVSSFKTSRNRPILDQSERVHLNNHLSNYCTLQKF